jgi:hypothetical protein
LLCTQSSFPLLSLCFRRLLNERHRPTSGARTVCYALIVLLALSLMTVSACASEAAPHLGNFNGQGGADLDWHNVTTGEVTIWILNGLGISGYMPGIANISDTNWRIIADVDLNGDGNADILWHNVSTGDNAAWLSNGTAFNSVAFQGVPDTNWQIVGTGDFDGDGKSEILWRNGQTGENCIWLLSGSELTVSATNIASVTDPNWHVAAVADFNGDGKADILWHNASTREIVLWLMNGGTLVSSGSLGYLPDQNWIVAAADDFNGDGKAEVVIRQPISGEDRMWMLSGTSIDHTDAMQTVAGANWVIAGTGDLNGDGNADIVWRDLSTGNNYVWFMNGAWYLENSGTGPLQPVSGQDWVLGGDLSSGIVPNILVPAITSLSRTSGPSGVPITISGANFGASQGTSKVTINSVTANITSWSPTSISVTVPNTASTGAVVVTVGGQTSNGVTFTVNSDPAIPVVPNSGCIISALQPLVKVLRSANTQIISALANSTEFQVL